MLFEIKNRFNGEVLFKFETTEIRGCVEAAVRARTNLSGADLSEMDLSDSNLSRTNLFRADLSDSDLSDSNLSRTNLSETNLSRTNLFRANLSRANLFRANLSGTDLSRANLFEANLSGAHLFEANLSDAKNLIKTMGVIPGSRYWKRFNEGLKNNGYQFVVGLNKLRPGEVFASDERVPCSSPGFHFASRSWCAANYPKRAIEALIRIPKEAHVNEPWGTNGKASADMIEILQVFDVATGEDVTDKYRRLPA